MIVVRFLRRSRNRDNNCLDNRVLASHSMCHGYEYAQQPQQQYRTAIQLHYSLAHRIYTDIQNGVRYGYLMISHTKNTVLPNLFFLQNSQFSSRSLCKCLFYIRRNEYGKKRKNREKARRMEQKHALNERKKQKKRSAQIHRMTLIYETVSRDTLMRNQFTLFMNPIRIFFAFCSFVGCVCYGGVWLFSLFHFPNNGIPPKIFRVGIRLNAIDSIQAHKHSKPSQKRFVNIFQIFAESVIEWCRSSDLY